jgi:type IV pilus assembly protein PilV
MINLACIKKQTGFTLIEVLVAVVILALGLIGLAGLQATGLANNQSAYNRSQVSQLAYDITDRMRSNSSVAASYVAATAAGSIPVCPNGTNPCTSCTTTATPCNQAAMVTKDVFEWKNALRTTVPNGDGFIVQEPPAGSGIYRVTVQWDDDKSGAPNTNFVLRFRID